MILTKNSGLTWNGEGAMPLSLAVNESILLKNLSYYAREKYCLILGCTRKINI